MLTNIAPLVLAFALFTLAHHHRRAVRRHDRSVEAWRLALRLALRAELPQIAPPRCTPKPRARARRALR